MTVRYPNRIACLQALHLALRQDGTMRGIDITNHPGVSYRQLDLMLEHSWVESLGPDQLQPYRRTFKIGTNPDVAHLRRGDGEYARDVKKEG